MKLYHRIKKRREELDVSQNELAIKLGYKSRSSINKIELGKADIPQSKIQGFADALCTTPAYLMGWTDDPHNWEQIGNDEGIYPPKDYEGSYDDYVKFKMHQEQDVAFPVSKEEQSRLHKYRSIDNKGKHTVDTVLEMEYIRCNKPHLMVNVSHTIEGTTEEELQHDDIMKNF